MSTVSTPKGRIDPSAATLVRSIGATERLFYRYSEANPTHFLLVAEFDGELAEDQLRGALDAVQTRHPLLTVQIEDRPVSRLGFYRPDEVAPIPLTVRHSSEDSWHSLAAQELSRPFDRSIAPLIRATLLRTPSSSTVLLTFDHTIADGISSMLVFDDLVGALNGGPVLARSTPPVLEDLLAQRVRAVDPPPTEPDARMTIPSTIRPFDGAAPHLHTATLSQLETARLVNRCRAERTTVHAALLVAGSSVRARLHGDTFVRALSPIDIRKLIHNPPDCAVYIACTTTGLATTGDESFWTRARMMTDQLAAARSASGVLIAAAGLAQAIDTHADRADAEDVFTHQLPWELLMTNLGRQTITSNFELRPRALWGPIVQSQTAREYVTGIVTYGKRMRMVAVGYQPTAPFLDGVVAALEKAVAG